MKFSYAPFRGEAPIIAPAKLPPPFATTAINCKLSSRDLQAYQDIGNPFELCKLAPINTVGLIIDSRDQTLYDWLQWSQSEVQNGPNIDVVVLPRGAAEANNCLTLDVTGCLDFGVIAVGEESDPLTLTITNNTESTITITSIVATAPFSASANTACYVLDPDESCAIQVTVTPDSTGLVEGTLTIENDTTCSPDTVCLTAVGCAGIAEGCGLQVCPLLDFGCVETGVLSSEMLTTITNASGTPITVLGLLVVNRNVPSEIPYFRITSAPTLPFTIAAGGTQTIGVSALAGNGPAGFEQSLVVISDAETSPDYILLTAMVCTTGKKLAITPPTNTLHTLSNVCQADSKTFTIFNVGNQSVTISAISLNISAFTLIAPTTPLVLAPGASVGVTVRYDTENDNGNPKTNRTLTVTSDAPTVTATVTYVNDNIPSVWVPLSSSVTLGTTCCGVPPVYATATVYYANLGPNTVQRGSISSPAPFTSNYQGAFTGLPIGCRGDNGLQAVGITLVCTPGPLSASLVLSYTSGGQSFTTSPVMMTGVQDPTCHG